MFKLINDSMVRCVCCNSNVCEAEGHIIDEDRLALLISLTCITEVPNYLALQAVCF